MIKMNCYDEKVKSDIFKASTTYQNDYKKYCGVTREFPTYERQREEVRTPPPKPKRGEDHETFAQWREGIHIPFDLLLNPKPIIQTDPRKPFKKLEPIARQGTDEAIKTRPRVYMTPAVSMDDVPEAEMRNLLCQHVYTSEWRRAEKEATENFKKIIPQIGKIETKDTVTLQTDLYKPINEKFRRLGRTWDDTQRRGFSDPTREFWIHKDPPVICGACVDPLRNIVEEKTKDTISSLIKEDRLRLPHDKTIPGYMGYRPMMPLGLSLAKVDLPAVHPFLSTSQTLTTRCNKGLQK
ncbi:uncharacterized protein [Leptinotarsa decemlineata]|uniref:uncharacterized protein n=1 Tax=Leptinotarsa decemlineata TaxID=7539 RepID=UPI003D304E3C